MSYKSHSWSNADGELSGTRAFVRLNESIRNEDRTAYPYVLMITLVFQSVRADGMPADLDELSLADNAEEAIADRLESEYAALVGMMVTSDGTRDLFFFLPTDIDENAIENLIDSTKTQVNFDFVIEKDSEWGPYSYLCDLTTGCS